MLRSSIDLGTNTCLLLIAEWDPAAKQATRIVGDYSTIVRLGKGVDQTKVLDPEAMERTLMCLKDYAARVAAAGLDPSKTIAVGTSSSRDARNGAEFYARVEKETGFRFRVISGDDEAKYSFLGGLLPGMDPARSIVIDIGGGSTELIGPGQGSNDVMPGGQSVDIGSVRFTERYLKSDPVTDDEFWACQDEIDSQLAKLKAWRASLAGTPHFVGVAGTVTTLAQWHLDLKDFEAKKIDGCVLTRGDVHRMVEELKWRSNAERAQLPGVNEGRADVLLAGGLVLWRAMETLDFPECVVSTRGLRFGVLGI